MVALHEHVECTISWIHVHVLSQICCTTCRIFHLSVTFSLTCQYYRVFSILLKWEQESRSNKFCMSTEYDLLLIRRHFIISRTALNSRITSALFVPEQSQKQTFINRWDCTAVCHTGTSHRTAH